MEISVDTNTTNEQIHLSVTHSLIHSPDSFPLTQINN